MEGSQVIPSNDVQSLYWLDDYCRTLTAICPWVSHALNSISGTIPIYLWVKPWGFEFLEILG